MNSYEPTPLRHVALTLLLVSSLMMLMSCGTMGTTGSKGVACTALPPSISFAYSDKIQESSSNRLDTLDTVNQVRNYNARIKAICEEE